MPVDWFKAPYPVGTRATKDYLGLLGFVVILDLIYAILTMHRKLDADADKVEVSGLGNIFDFLQHFF